MTSIIVKDDVRSFQKAIDTTSRAGALAGVAMGSLDLVLGRLEDVENSLVQAGHVSPDLIPNGAILKGLTQAREHLRLGRGLLELMSYGWPAMRTEPQTAEPQTANTLGQTDKGRPL